MARYPISHNAGKKLSEYFREILTFHIPLSKKKRILNPTRASARRSNLYDFNSESIIEERAQ